MGKSGLKIADVIKDMHRGIVAVDADAKLTELVAAVKEHGKVGTFTLRIDIKPKGNDEADITAEITTKVPKPKPRPALFYLTDDNNLSRTDPTQDDLPGIESNAAPGNVTPMPKPVDPSPMPQQRREATPVAS